LQKVRKNTKAISAFRSFGVSSISVFEVASIARLPNILSFSALAKPWSRQLQQMAIDVAEAAAAESQARVLSIATPFSVSWRLHSQGKLAVTP
jgi:hypothetical protein